MMLAWLLMVSLAAGDLSQAAQAALRPLTDAIREARSKQAALPCLLYTSDAADE